MFAGSVFEVSGLEGLALEGATVSVCELVSGSGVLEQPEAMMATAAMITASRLSFMAMRNPFTRFGRRRAVATRWGDEMANVPVRSRFTIAAMSTTETERLLIRAPVESDRPRFVELFTNEAFTVFSGGVHDVESANDRFDRMLTLVDAVPYAKQPVIEKATGTIVGYTGAGTVVFEGLDRLEWGWRLVPEARGLGYATEATAALLEVADAHDNGEMLCIIAVDNGPSRRVADKLDFGWWQRFTWPDEPYDPTDLLIRQIGSGGPPLETPDLG